MPSLARGYILKGVNWNYRILKSLRGDGTHISTVFKAQVIRHENTNVSNIPQWAFIKVAPYDNATARENLQRERSIYHLPGITSAGCFRKMYDVVNESTIALEWLDTTLADVKYQPSMPTYSIIMVSLKAILSSCIYLEGQKYVNTDYKPANILLSGVETGRVTAKVGDLGLVAPVGQVFNAQPYAMRAPEVFLGQACKAPSPVWAAAAMFLCWIRPGILGAWDSPHPLINEAWSMAKIKRLFPHWDLSISDNAECPILKTRVTSAKGLCEEIPQLQDISSFDQEIQKVEMPPQLGDLLRFMLIPDPIKRPSTSSVLGSKDFLAFQKLMGE